MKAAHCSTRRLRRSRRAESARANSIHLELGEARNPGAFAMLAWFARERLGVR